MRIEATLRLPQRSGPYGSIQALRGGAALLVTMVHAAARIDPDGAGLPLGNVGVDVFFVISGFVMETSIANRMVTPGAFLLRRFVRLAPLYWLMTLTMVAAWALIPASFPHLHPTFAHVGLSLLFVPHVSPDTGAVTPLLGQGWTLNFEMVFYALFAAALWLRPVGRAWVIGGALLGLPLLGLALRPLGWPVLTLLSPLLIEFLGGILLARLVQAGPRPDAAGCWGGLVAAALLLTGPAPAAGDDWVRLLRYGGPAVLVVGGAVGLEALGRLRIPAAAMLLGDASYSLYLTHGFAIALLAKFWPGGALWPFVATAMAAAAALGVAVYWLIERRLLVLLRRPPVLLGGVLARP